MACENQLHVNDKMKVLYPDFHKIITHLFIITPGTRSHLPPTTVAKALHDRINLLLENLSQLGAVLVDSGCFAIVQPGVVEHQPDVVHVLPGILVLTYNHNTKHGTVE